MGWLNRLFSVSAPNYTAVEFIAKNLGYEFKFPREFMVVLKSEGQRIAREMDYHAFNKPQNYIYIVPYTLIGEFNLLIQFFENQENEEAIRIICEAAVVALSKYKAEFSSCHARIHLNVPTAAFSAAKHKLKLA